ncbi:pentatricopeptide repeat-containing protein At5g27110 [Andrographis paniculata]|uniref:pentatricopeptide repeat-containing protein At5g27110 n=1 Tax=Andrographis paniculata TaxID=175694 RepID=UPI0021E81B84|nr:pentatricopeptide repeat-containing protein At5g27110 [Andrographis paniculata]
MDAITTRLLHLSKSLNKLRSLKPIQVLHQKAISFGLQHNVALCKNLINLYISRGDYQSAKLIFQGVQNPSNITLWNALIAAYVKNAMFQEALSLFEKLLRFPNLKPDSYTYPSLLKACGGLGRTDYGEMNHSLLMKLGFMSDVVIASSLIGMYAKCGMFISAVKVFDEMPERDLACWNNVITCYYQSGQWKKALEYFDKMRSYGLRPDSVSYTVAISSCGRLIDLERGEKIHDEARRTGLAMDSYVSAALVDMFGKCGALKKAKEVFDEIRDKSLVSWNAVIGGYSLVGDTNSCIRLFEKMVGERVRPSSTTISSLLMACAKSANLRAGKFIHGYITRSNVASDIFLESSLIDMYVKCGRVLTAEIIFNRMAKSNIVAWNVMISGYVTAGCYFEALRTFDDMRKSGVKPDAITFTSALSACSQLAALERGRELHECIVENRLDSNEILAGSLLDMYAKCGAVEEAESVFNRLSTRDVVSWTSMIVSYGSHGRAPEALKLFEDMLRVRVPPDRVTFLAVISACSHAGLVDEGRRCFKLMVNDYGIRPSVAEYSCLIDLLGRAGRLIEAYDILRKNADIKDDVELLSTLFAVCGLHGELELGEKIAKLIIEKDPDDHSTYVGLEKMYAGKKKWDKVREIRFKMKEFGLKKNPGCSWIEIDETIRSFVAEDRTFAQREDIYGCLSILYNDMENDEMEAQEEA